MHQNGETVQCIDALQQHIRNEMQHQNIGLCTMQQTTGNHFMHTCSTLARGCILILSPLVAVNGYKRPDTHLIHSSLDPHKLRPAVFAKLTSAQHRRAY